MKCPNCGAEIGASSKFCDSCGSQISYEMRREQEQLNKQGCPKCGSSNIQFRRENQGEVRGKNAKRVIHRTVGFCKDCGYTWYPNAENEMTRKNNMIWWVLGWIFFFPVPVMVLIWRKKNTWSIKIKIVVTAVFWIVFILFYALSGSGGNSEPSKTDVQNEPRSAVQATNTPAKNTSTSTPAPTPKTSANSQSMSSEFNIKELPVMNGTKTERIGTYSMCYLLSEDCTEETLAKWYAEIKDKGYSWSIIRYSDFAGDINTGVYANNGLIEKDVQLADDGSVISNEGETVYVVNENGSLSMMN